MNYVKNIKKTIIFKLIFLLLLSNFGATYCKNYKNNTKPQAKPQKLKKINKAPEETVWQKSKRKLWETKNFVYRKFIQAKDKIAPYITTDNIAIASFFSIYMFANAFALYAHKKRIRALRNPSLKTKKYVTAIAKRLKIKNPKNIRVKVINSNSYNGGSDIFGNIIITKKVDAKIKKNRCKFIIGHELSHRKHGDAIRSYISSLALKLGFFGLYAKYKPLKPVTNFLQRNAPQNPILQNRFYSIIYGLHIAAIRTGLFLCDIIIANTIRRIFERRADLESASVSKNLAKGGINLFRKFKKILTSKVKKFSWGRWLRYKFANPHPSPSKRIQYLKWFKKKNYKATSFFAKLGKKITRPGLKLIKSFATKLPRFRFLG
ncbi:M48 family metalloprotease [Candidatus Dependentiae bacterium]